MKIPPTLRNIVIIVVLSAIVGGLQSGREAGDAVTQALRLGFFGAFAWIASRLYREHRSTLYALGDRHRTVLYCATGALILILTATDRLWNTSFGSIVWLVVVAGAIYALFAVYRSSRQY